MPSSVALRQVALNPNASTNALQQSTTRLPALEEEVQLEPVGTGSSDSTEADAPRAEPSRLRKVSSAISTRMPFWGNKNKEKDVEADKVPVGPSVPAEPSIQYSSNMVDVLDTVGR